MYSEEMHRAVAQAVTLEELETLVVDGMSAADVDDEDLIRAIRDKARLLNQAAPPAEADEPE
jgi:hypothetical protein